MNIGMSTMLSATLRPRAVACSSSANAIPSVSSRPTVSAK
jgi:hypothetical protein